MPKRTTLLYTSADAPNTTENQLYVYYCKYSGKHAFTTGMVLFPREAENSLFAVAAMVEPALMSSVLFREAPRS